MIRRGHLSCGLPNASSQRGRRDHSPRCGVACRLLGGAPRLSQDGVRRQERIGSRAGVGVVLPPSQHPDVLRPTRISDEPQCRTEPATAYGTPSVWLTGDLDLPELGDSDERDVPPAAVMVCLPWRRHEGAVHPLGPRCSGSSSPLPASAADSSTSSRGSSPTRCSTSYARSTASHSTRARGCRRSSPTARGPSGDVMAARRRCHTSSASAEQVSEKPLSASTFRSVPAAVRLAVVTFAIAAVALISARRR